MALLTGTYQIAAEMTPVIAFPHGLGKARLSGNDDALAWRCAR